MDPKTAVRPATRGILTAGRVPVPSEEQAQRRPRPGFWEPTVVFWKLAKHSPLQHHAKRERDFWPQRIL